MQVKFVISTIIFVFGCLIIFLSSGFKLLSFSDVNFADVGGPSGKVLGASEEAIENNNKLPINNFSLADNSVSKKDKYSPAALEAQKLLAKLVDNQKTVLPDAEYIKIFPASMDKIAAPVRAAASSGYELASGAGAVIDVRTDKILFAKGADSPVPIASITKLATALVFLDNNPGWEEIYQVRPDDIVSGGRIYLNPGEKIRIKDLFNLSLVCSSNSAAAALVSASGLSKAEFVGQMNAKAEEFGLSNMNFVEPTGLSAYNSASARELVIFAKHALADENISAATLSREYSFSTLAGRKITVYNTDSLLDIFPQNGIKILGGKTGFTNLARYCFVGKFIDKNGHELISVILGSNSRKESFLETRNMVEWAYANYNWQ